MGKRMRAGGKVAGIRDISCLFLYSLLLMHLLVDAHGVLAGTQTQQDRKNKKLSIVRTFFLADGSAGEKMVSTFTSEVAVDEEERRIGLSGRERMPDSQGMLFVLDNSWYHMFWMKGMKFPLDILFFDSRKRLIRVMENLPPCDDVCPLHGSPENAAYAFEINAGLVKKLEITEGDRLVFTEE